MSRILVIGGTGTVGSTVVERLAGGSHEVRVMTRSAEKAEGLPDGVEGVVGDLADPASLPAAFEGVERVCLITPLSQSEDAEGKAAVAAARDAGVERLVYMSVHRVWECPQAPHFASKIEIQRAIEDSGLAHTFIQPNNFYQNDQWFKDAVLKYGVYPQPFGRAGLSRVDTRDIAEAIATALTEDGHLGESYPLVGPHAWTAEETAELWSRALGRPIRYGGDDLDAWAVAAKQGMPAWLVDDFAIMYRFFQDEGLAATDEELEKQEEILRHPPRRYEDYVTETARAWQG